MAIIDVSVHISYSYDIPDDPVYRQRVYEATGTQACADIDALNEPLELMRSVTDKSTITHTLTARNGTDATDPD